MRDDLTIFINGLPDGYQPRRRENWIQDFMIGAIWEATWPNGTKSVFKVHYWAIAANPQDGSSTEWEVAMIKLVDGKPGDEVGIIFKDRIVPPNWRKVPTSEQVTRGWFT